jgi:hypothetical protein
MTNATPNAQHDAVNHPSHYTQYPVEVIELTRHMTFNRGNAVKYVARAGYKGGPEKELEDIDKAIWYLKDERELVRKKLAEQKEASNNTGGSWGITDLPADKIIAKSAYTDTLPANFVQLDVIEDNGAKG